MRPPGTEGLYGYVVDHMGKPHEVYAETLLKAKDKFLADSKIPRSKRHLVSAFLCERPDGTEVIHVFD